jgi:glycosyltransferase involved in cell wall biosynthesis
MPDKADVCLIAEGGYPYMLGGVSSWIDSLIRASPTLRFSLVAIRISSQPRVSRYELPANVTEVTDVTIDVCPPGRKNKRRDDKTVEEATDLMRSVLTTDDGTGFVRLVDLIRCTGFGQTALLDSKAAWTGMRRAYERATPHGPLVDYFWSWRFLAKSLLAVATTPIPDAGIYHAVSTGYSGMVGACAAHLARRPLVVTEHGIYTNERRIELSTAEWLFDSGASGFAVADKAVELVDVWMDAFESFSRTSYAQADLITTQYRANQMVQIAGGASPAKMRIIPNGIDSDRYGALKKSTEPRRPTVLMVGRIVPIKDTRTFISAVAILRDMVPDVVAVLIGPEEEDPDYAAGCRALVSQLELDDTIQFLGRVPDVDYYLERADVIALTSISEAQPIALLEAAAVGLPAVTTDVGSCREIIEGFDGDPVIGRGGFVVSACNPHETAQALASILLDHPGRMAMGDVMKLRTANWYSKHRVRRLYEDMYATLSPSGSALGSIHDKNATRAAA